MSSLKPLVSVAAFVMLASLPLAAQQEAAPPPPNTEFTITKIDTAFQNSPGTSGSGYDKRVRDTGQWLEVEVTFNWQPRVLEPKYLDDLTISYFVLLKNPSKESPAGTLLVGKVEHINVAQGKDLKSVMYVSPKSLQRLFDGKIPVNVKQTVAGAGAELLLGGAVVAGFATDGRGADKARPWAWWDAEMFKDKKSGVLLNKLETPFAPLAWDYHEEIKSTPATR